MEVTRLPLADRCHSSRDGKQPHPGRLTFLWLRRGSLVRRAAACDEHHAGCDGSGAPHDSTTNI